MVDDEGLDIAIVGMAGRFPGAADVDEFWRRVLRGEPTVSTFTPEELAADGVPRAEYEHPDYVPVFGVLDDVDRFDAGFFGYTPRDARLLDPQQRVFLECAWHALESAGHLTRIGDELVGVYAGASLSTYLLRNLMTPNAASEYELFMANDKDSIATRVSYHLGLRGPAVAVQTACSSSLVAVHLASQALLAGECDVALAGAAHVRLPMRSGYRYEPGGIMARDGVCRPFDAQASGTVGGNGAAIVVLRRLADAVRDRDTIYAVVKGSAINNDGSSKVGYTAPSMDGQVAVIQMAQQAADVDPATIGYVETHGTGTALGDQIEFQALTRAFPREGKRALGSVKAVTGHLDVAAGVTGLIKASLAVHHGVIPPSPYFTAPHPDLAFDGSSFFVNTEPVNWSEPRRAAVSSFGIGGTNAHVILEQAPDAGRRPAERGEYLLPLSARTPGALAKAGDDLKEHLSFHDVPLADVAHTLQTTRRKFEHRLVVVGRDRDEAVARLALKSDVDTAVGDATDGTVAFLFPGQGSQHPDMARDLYRAEAVFRRHVDECAEALRPHLELDLRDVVYPRGDREQAEELLRQTWLTQPALFVVEYALARLWQSWGVRPSAMLGHSIGEYVAATLAGVFDLPDALAVVAARGRLMQSVPAGAMLSVPLPAAELADRLPHDVELAAANAPRLSVVAGPQPQIAALAEVLRGDGVKCRELRTSHAFHSSMMEPVTAEFAEYVSRFELRPPAVPVLSNVTGDWLDAADATDPKYWARQLREPVRFNECAERLVREPCAVLEVGPGTTLTTLMHQHPGALGRSVASLGGPKSDQTAGITVARALGQLWLAGVEVDWDLMWGAERPGHVALPGYPFERDRHWVDARHEDTPVEQVVQPEPERLSPLETIRRIWVELLGIADIGLDQDFFELGGHSLLGTKVVARIREALDVDLPASAMFTTPTIGGLAAAVEDLRADQPDELGDLLAEIKAMSPAQLREQLAETRRDENP
ncbi:type I polyketide synthase [Lentzea sp. NPDC005914]|uniref:type I polyketide synthase n=1 Tax=Lentzea sp. NPDC005914 TaxID=3154572 RepID=UPI0033D9C5D4